MACLSSHRHSSRYVNNRWWAGFRFSRGRLLEKFSSLLIPLGMWLRILQTIDRQLRIKAECCIEPGQSLINDIRISCRNSKREHSVWVLTLHVLAWDVSRMTSAEVVGVKKKRKIFFIYKVHFVGEGRPSAFYLDDSQTF